MKTPTENTPRKGPRNGESGVFPSPDRRFDQFPDHCGNLTYFEPGSVYPYVVGGIQHEGSGLSLTAGATITVNTAPTA